MSARSPEALVRPELLIWAREDAGLTIETVARKVGTSAERVESWEKGERRPTIIQLRKLGNVYKRPLAVFYLAEPPKKFQALKDFRRVSPDARRTESFALRLAIRQARYLRDVALDLYAQLDQEPPEVSLTASLDDDPEEVAASLRKELGVSLDEQMGWVGSYDALNGWRSRIEDLGVMVLQMSGVEVEEARGFSISSGALPVISINVKDAPAGRVFSMHPELTHLTLRSGGLCDFHDFPRAGEKDIEVFCNHVAGASLVPGEVLLQTPEVRHQEARGTGFQWSSEELVALARRFSVSREVILRRLLILGRTSEVYYREMRSRFQEEYQRYRERLAQSEGGPTWDRRALARVGKLFARLALENYYQERITAGDLAEYFGIKLQHMPAIEREVFGRQIAFEVAG